MLNFLNKLGESFYNVNKSKYNYECSHHWGVISSILLHFCLLFTIALECVLFYENHEFILMNLKTNPISTINVTLMLFIVMHSIVTSISHENFRGDYRSEIAFKPTLISLIVLLLSNIIGWAYYFISGCISLYNDVPLHVDEEDALLFAVVLISVVLMLSTAVFIKRNYSKLLDKACKPIK